MIRKTLFILFRIVLTSAIGAIVLEKWKETKARNNCHANGGTWNFMEMQCD